MNYKFFLIGIVLSSIFLTNCQKCEVYDNPPLYLNFRIIDKNSSMDLLYSKKYSLDSIQVYSIENNLIHRIKLELQVDTVNERVIIGSSDWIQKSLAGQKDYFLNLNNADIDTVIFNVEETGDKCNSAEQIKNFEINSVELSHTEMSLYGVYKK